MANDELLTDDYVASLLAKDAKESSIKFSALGLEGFAQSKPPANKPKPNTRFLRNIIKDTDTHNAALLAKEAAESRIRLQSLASSKHHGEKASQVGRGDIRRRQLGDIAAILGGRPTKRRKKEELKSDNKRSRRLNTSGEGEEPPEKFDEDRRRKYKRRDGDQEDGDESRSHKSKYDDTDGDEKSRTHRSHRKRDTSASRNRERHREDRKKRHRSISDDGTKGEEERRRRHMSRSRSPRDDRTKKSQYRSRSPKRKRSRSPEPEQSHRSRRHRRAHSREVEQFKDSRNARRLDYDSDPLEEIIGPRPPSLPEVKSRGRGTFSQASGIDSRFSASYDPTIDVQLEAEEENDWDQALEALRDRQKWKQQGADRLRAAGFTEEEIGKWEKGGEKREEDVRWAKQGEGREWDKGKVLDEDGIVTVEPSWGRLKGT